MSAQPVYSNCFICGVENPIGLGLRFRSEGDQVVTEFTPDERHQGYPGRVHGGIIYAVLDETTGRAAYLRNQWVFTGTIEVRYHLPAVVGETLRFSGAILSERTRVMELKGEARRVSDGALVASAKGLFVKLTDEQRAAMEEVIGVPEEG